jgi:hypothetical protein
MTVPANVGWLILVLIPVGGLLIAEGFGRVGVGCTVTAILLGLWFGGRD